MSLKILRIRRKVKGKREKVIHFILSPFPSSRGFTLIEIMVSMSLFSVVAVLGISAVISASDLARRAQTERGIIDNLNFALETMSRKIRLGNFYYCKDDMRAVPLPENVRNCSTGANSLAFQSGSNQILYYLNSDPANPLIKRIYTRKNTDDALPLTSPDININDLKFISIGSDSPPPALPEPGTVGFQPRVLVLVRGQAQIKNKTIEFNIETTLSQRLLEN